MLHFSRLPCGGCKDTLKPLSEPFENCAHTLACPRVNGTNAHDFVTKPSIFFLVVTPGLSLFITRAHILNFCVCAMRRRTEGHCMHEHALDSVCVCSSLQGHRMMAHDLDCNWCITFEPLQNAYTCLVFCDCDGKHMQGIARRHHDLVGCDHNATLMHLDIVRMPQYVSVLFPLDKGNHQHVITCTHMACD
jgi:hypothetical protein